jgi:hypothetical protein
MPHNAPRAHPGLSPSRSAFAARHDNPGAAGLDPRAAAALASEDALRFESTLQPDPETANKISMAADEARTRASAAKQHSSLVIAWGMYSRSCAEVEMFARACVGCGKASIAVGIALVDHVTDGSACKGLAHTIPSWRVLSPKSEPPVPAEMRYWPRTHTLFQQLVQRVPQASWYVKLDSDTFFNALELWHILAAKQAQLAAARVGYLGKEMRLFSYMDRRLVYMQGGAYVLSRYAAHMAAACSLGSWRHCPNRVFKDLNNRHVNELMRRTCYVPSTIAEDLYVGVCMREANVTGASQPCMLTLGAGTVHNQSASTGGAEAGGFTNASWGKGSASPAHWPQRVASVADVRSRFTRLLKTRCACPISVHPLKSNEQLLWVRNRSKTRSCASHW